MTHGIMIGTPQGRQDWHPLRGLRGILRLAPLTLLTVSASLGALACDGSGTGLDDRDDDGWTEREGDCDDTEEGRYPGADEVCNGMDDDCDSAVDEGFDVDEDGATSCGGDCDDSDAGTNPGLADTCDGVDNDCDGAVDEAPPAWYRDGDGDGYGTELDVVYSCAAVPGKTLEPGDCKDDNRNAHPDQGQFFDFDRGDGSFDYNCDGRETWKYSGAGECYTSLGFCLPISGWTGTVPNCGEVGEWLSDCAWNLAIECRPISYIEKRQACL